MFSDDTNLFIYIAFLARKLNLTADDLSKAMVKSKERKTSAEFWNEAIELAVKKNNNVRKKIKGN